MQSPRAASAALRSAVAKGAGGVRVASLGGRGRARNRGVLVAMLGARVRHGASDGGLMLVAMLGIGMGSGATDGGLVGVALTDGLVLDGIATGDRY